jgi:DNA primase catalytic core
MTINEVVQASDIIAVADQIIGARTGQQGREITYDCPRHKSASRKSFHVSPDKQLWMCHGCGVGGDVLSLVEFVRFGVCGKDLDSASRKNALEELARISGIELQPISEEKQKDQQEREEVFELLTQIKDHWVARLSERPDVIAWIGQQWGFSAEEIRRLEIGYAPENQRPREVYALALKTGAYIKIGQDKMLPLFQGRVMFPYMERGQCVYATGRKTPWTPENKYEDGKYKKMLTWSENRDYVSRCVKNDRLYNHTAIYGSGPVIITEGTADCARLILAGFSAISPGTTTIPAHTYEFILRQLSGKEIIVLNDNDEAGSSGAEKMAAEFSERGIDVKIASFPESDQKIDVCSFFQNGGTTEDIERIISEAKSVQGQKADILPGGLRDTEYGNAQRFAELAKNRVKHVKDFGWITWDSKRWLRDNDYAIEIYRQTIIPKVHEEAKEAFQLDEKKGKILLKWAKKCEGTANSNASLSAAKTMPDIYLQNTDKLDSDPWLFNCKNGTVDLKTGKISAHKPENMITKISPVEYQPGKPATRWNQFLQEITGDDPEMINFLQCAAGYTLSGSTREQICFFAYGLGANGKSVFLNTLLNIFGDYGIQTAPDLLMQTTTGTNRHPTEQADLMGHRLAVVQESDPGKKMAVSAVKRITSSDRISARFMHGNFFEFVPVHKLWIAGNHKPIIHDNTNSIWRRLKLIPFDCVIPPEKQDKDLLLKLQAELSGILSWAVEGCLKYQKYGIPEVERIRRATNDYRDASNVVLDFISEKCVCQPLDKNLKMYISELYREYQLWADDEGEIIWSKRAFSAALMENGFERCRGSNGKWIFRGITLKSIATRAEIGDGNIVNFPNMEQEADIDFTRSV